MSVEEDSGARKSGTLTLGHSGKLPERKKER